MKSDFVYYNGIDYEKSADNAIYPIQLSGVGIFTILWLII